MRVMEVGTKLLGQGRKEEAYDFFRKSYNLYSLFWGLNMKLIATDDIKKIDGMYLADGWYNDAEATRMLTRPEYRKPYVV